MSTILNTFPSKSGSSSGDLKSVDRYTQAVITHSTYQETGNFNHDTNIFPAGIEDEWTVVSSTKCISKDGRYTLTTNGAYYSDEILYKVLYGSTSYSWNGRSGGCWVKMECASPTMITRMSMYAENSSAKRNYRLTLSGSHDDVNWVDLWSFYGYEKELATLTRDIIITNPDSYRYYRIYHQPDSSSDDFYLSSWRVVSWTSVGEIVTRDKYLHELDLDLDDYEVGKIINMRASSYSYTETQYHQVNLFPTSGWSHVSDSSYNKYTSSGFTIESSGCYSSSYNISLAFDGSTSTYWESAYSSTASASWVKVTCPSPIKVTKMGFDMISTANAGITSIVISGSLSGEDWTTLYTHSGEMTSHGVVTLSDPDYYSYYKMDISNGGGGYVSMREWRIAEYMLENVPVTKTSFENPPLRVNGLEEKQIMGTLRSDKYYNLVYDGSVFLAQPTTLGVNPDPIVITSSGTYSIDPQMTYKILAIGGGGGAVQGYSSYYTEYVPNLGGGGGGVIEDILVPDGDTMTITVGAAGSNATGSASYGPGSATGTAGGDTIVGKFTAHGGSPASIVAYTNSNTPDEYTTGAGGLISGGSGRVGYDGSSASSGYGYGGTGITVNGVEYGKGGTCYGNTTGYHQFFPATPGVVVLYPLI